MNARLIEHPNSAGAPLSANRDSLWCPLAERRLYIERKHLSGNVEIFVRFKAAPSVHRLLRHAGLLSRSKRTTAMGRLRSMSQCPVSARIGRDLGGSTEPILVVLSGPKTCRRLSTLRAVEPALSCPNVQRSSHLQRETDRPDKGPDPPNAPC